MSSPDPTQIGPFKILRRLGIGGMGVVYEALYEKNGRKVALKLLSPDVGEDPALVERFTREMEILKKLKHRHIIRYYGGGSVERRRFYAMEVLPGGSLEDRIKERGRLTWEQTLDYTRQIVSGLEHAHTSGVIHRDLKPANLLLSENGVLKLTDFGIARDTQRTALTADGKTVGTMAYMAPEQITGKHPITGKTDLYAVGCVMYEMLTGATPFAGETQAAEMLFKHVEEVPRNVRELAHDTPIAIAELIDELLEKEPSERPFDALATKVRLDEIRERASSNESVAGRTLIDSRALTAADRKALSAAAEGPKAKKRKRKKKAENVPIHERLPVLVATLLAIVATAVWALWPEGEDYYFEQAAALMETGSSADMQDAKRGPVTVLLEDFPDGKHAEQARKWMVQIEADALTKRVERKIARNGDPDSEPERLYMAARQLESFGDRLSALRKYESMKVLLQGSEASAPYAQMANDRIAMIESSVDSDGDRVDFVNEQIAEGDSLFLDGEEIKARTKWKSIVRLYREDPEFDTQVGRAQDRLLEPGKTIAAEREAAGG